MGHFPSFIKMQYSIKMPLFCVLGMFSEVLFRKNPIWGIFSLKMGHFFVPKGWQPWMRSHMGTSSFAKGGG